MISVKNIHICFQRRKKKKTQKQINKRYARLISYFANPLLVSYTHHFIANLRLLNINYKLLKNSGLLFYWFSLFCFVLNFWVLSKNISNCKCCFNSSNNSVFLTLSLIFYSYFLLNHI